MASLLPFATRSSSSGLAWSFAAGDIGKGGCELEARIVGVAAQCLLADGNGLEWVNGLEWRRPFLGTAAGERIDGELQAALLQRCIIGGGRRVGRERSEGRQGDEQEADSNGSKDALHFYLQKLALRHSVLRRDLGGRLTWHGSAQASRQL
jgi:hypothetical protein